MRDNHIAQENEGYSDVVRFESERDAFNFACGTCAPNYDPGDILLGSVMSVDQSSVTKQQVAIYKLNVQSPDGGKIIPNAISAVDIPILNVGELVIFKVHTDSSAAGSEELSGMVGIIVGRVKPELHLKNGWNLKTVGN